MTVTKCSQLYTVPTVNMYTLVYSPSRFWGSPHPQSPLPCDAAQWTKRRSGASAPLPHFVCHSPFPPVSAAALLLDRQETNGGSGLCPHTTLRFCVSPLWEVPSLPTPAWTEPGWCVSPSTNTVCWLGANLPPRCVMFPA